MNPGPRPSTPRCGNGALACSSPSHLPSPSFSAMPAFFRLSARQSSSPLGPAPPAGISRPPGHFAPLVRPTSSSLHPRPWPPLITHPLFMALPRSWLVAGRSFPADRHAQIEQALAAAPRSPIIPLFGRRLSPPRSIHPRGLAIRFPRPVRRAPPRRPPGPLLCAQDAAESSSAGRYHGDPAAFVQQIPSSANLQTPASSSSTVSFFDLLTTGPNTSRSTDVELARAAFYFGWDAYNVRPGRIPIGASCFPFFMSKNKPFYSSSAGNPSRGQRRAPSSTCPDSIFNRRLSNQPSAGKASRIRANNSVLENPEPSHTWRRSKSVATRSEVRPALPLGS